MPVFGPSLGYGLTLEEIRTRVQRQFGDTSGVEITVADIDRWANDAQVDIARKTESLQEIAEISAVAGGREYTLPEDYISIRRVTVDGRKLHPTTLEQLDARSENRDTDYPNAEPTHFYVWGYKLFLYPAPSTAGSVNIDVWYSRAPVKLTDTDQVSELPATFHEDIVRYCLSRAKELDEETDEAQRIMNEYEGRVNLSKAEAQSQHLDTYPAIRLLPGDY